MVDNKFTWVPFFKELLEKICATSNPIDLYKEFKKLVNDDQYTDIDKIDPLSYIACICYGSNAAIKKAEIAKKSFNLKSTLYDIIGIPNFVMGRYHYFHEIYNCKTKEEREQELEKIISLLWDFAKQINTDLIKKETFELIINYRDVKIGKLSQIIYICKPEKYYSCDSTMLSYLYEKIDNNYESFLKIQKYCGDFNITPYLLSEQAWNYSQVRKIFQTYISHVGQNLHSYQNYINRHIIKKEELENKIYSITLRRLFEINNSSELDTLLKLLNESNEWIQYNISNGNGIPNAILNKHFKNFINNESFALPTLKSNIKNANMNKYGESMTDKPLNQILYGPPGTGKTYNTVLKAMSIIDNTEYKDISEEQYSALKTRFDELKQAGQIEFVTFHQSYSYEEFVEGIKPYIPEWGTTDNAEVKYVGENGIFKRICKKAESPIIKSNDNNLELNDNPKIWKVSLMKTGENEIRKDCMDNNRIRIGFDKYGEIINDETVFDDGGSRVLSAFIDKMEIGDIVLSCYSEKTIDAIGVVTSEYKWNNDFPQYKRYREVKWLAKSLNHNILEINNGTKFTLGTVYQLNNMSLKDVLDIVDEQEQVTSYKDNDKRYILIIDEINRGDVSKIFGELITLIEEDKRIGNKYQMKITLPYSKEQFGVPNNLYIIGTMNTADRSIALLDTALRRRFDFEEIMPKPELLNGKVVEGINLQILLTRINERITTKYDRDHQIGHSYLMGVNTKEQLERAYKNRILPLLNEYFYNESKTVAEILNCSEDELKTSDFISILGKAQGA